MRQAIVTKYLGPTNSKGGRIKATAEAGSVTIPWDHAAESEENHRNAAFALSNRFHWASNCELHGGAMPGGGYVFVLLPKKRPLNEEERAYRDAAQKHYHREGSIEIDDAPEVSISDDGGAYVEAWVWVYEDQLTR